MQRITKFSAIIGFLAVMTFVIGMFMYMPSVTQHGASLSPVAAFAWGNSGCGSCGDGGGGVKDGGGLDLPPRPTCAISASPRNINAGETATITWSTTNADTVTLNGNPAAKANSRDFTIGQTRTFKIVAANSRDSVTCETTVTVKEVVVTPRPTCDVSASPRTINAGEQSTITWNTTDADSVTLNGNPVAKNSSRAITIGQTRTFTIVATNAKGSVTCETVVTVKETPVVEDPVCTLDAAPATISRGENATLSWTTRRAETVTLNGQDVAKNDSRVVSPDATRTYTIVAKNSAGKSVNCQKTVVVKDVPVTQNPACTLDISPTTITRGQSATLTWTTRNAATVTLNGQDVAKNDSRVVSPDATRTYTLVARNSAGVTETCQKTIVVRDIPVENDPVCTLDGSPSTINRGETSTLNWTTRNAATVTLNGQDVAKNDSRVVSPDATRTYTIVATNNGGKSVTCQKTIVVRDTNPTLSCDSFSASPSRHGENGGTSNLSWNTTGATSVSIDQGVGSVSNDGDYSLFVGSSRTFTLTARNGSDSVTCQTSVTVDEDHHHNNDSDPVCSAFRASDRDIEEGDTIELSWETRRGDELTIKDSSGREIFDTDDNDEVEDGEIRVAPRKDTTYTLRVYDNDNDTDTCTVRVNVDEDDNKDNDDDEPIVITSIRDREPVTTISFRQVPYTGFDAGPTLAATFYALLALWALVAAYIVVIKKGSVLGFSLATAGFAPVAAHTAPVYTAPVVTRTATAFAPTNLPVAQDDEEMEEEEEVVEEDEDEDLGSIENRAFTAGIIFSKDALAVITRAGRDTAERLTIADAIIARAKESFPREDGWIAIDKTRIQSLFN